MELNSFEIAQNSERKKKLVAKLIQLKGGTSEDYEKFSIEELEAQIGIFREELDAPTEPNIQNSNFLNSKTELQNPKSETNSKLVIENGNSDLVVGIDEDAKVLVQYEHKVEEDFYKPETARVSEVGLKSGPVPGTGSELVSLVDKEAMVEEKADEISQKLETVEGELVTGTQIKNLREPTEKFEMTGGVPATVSEPAVGPPSAETKPVPETVAGTKHIIPFKTEDKKASTPLHSNLGNALEQVLVTKQQNVMPRTPVQEAIIREVQSSNIQNTKSESQNSKIQNLPPLPERVKKQEVEDDNTPRSPQVGTTPHTQEGIIHAKRDKVDGSKNRKDEDKTTNSGAGAPAPAAKASLTGSNSSSSTNAPVESFQAESNMHSKPYNQFPSKYDEADSFDKIVFWILLVIFILGFGAIVLIFWPDIKEMLESLFS